jgi:Tfp pilus assembly protein PilF
MSNFTTNASDDNIEKRLFKRLRFAIDQGKLLESKEDIKRVLKLNPRHAGATFFAGRYSFETGDFDNAQKFLVRVQNHETYGAKARKLLGEIRLNKFHYKYLENLNIAIKGQAYDQALDICEDILIEFPDSSETLFLATYAATMQGYPEKAEEYRKKFSQTNVSSEQKAELKAFIDAMFSAGYAPEIAVEKLMNITDQRLLTMPVRQKIKDLLSALKETEQFEKFIEREKNRPDANIDKLERELIGFLIEQKKYDKALELINKRPTDLLEDNILYTRLLIYTGKEEKAMLSARQLISVNPGELRLYEAWVDAWLGYFKRTAQIPVGADSTGKTYEEMAEEVLSRIKLDRLVKQNPGLLLKLLRLAVLSQNEKKVKQLKDLSVKIRFDNELSKILMETAEEFIALNRSSIAADLLESARNQIHDDQSLSVKLAEIYYIHNNPKSAAAILEDVMRARPDMTRAFLLWVDCMSILGNFKVAETRILQKMAEPELHDIVIRQLQNKLEVIRMQQYGEVEDYEKIEISDEYDSSQETSSEEKTENEATLDMLEDADLD